MSLVKLYQSNISDANQRDSINFDISCDKLSNIVSDMKLEIELIQLENNLLFAFLRDHYTKGYDQLKKLFDSKKTFGNRRSQIINSSQMQSHRASAITMDDKLSFRTGYSFSVREGESIYSIKRDQKLNISTKLLFIESDLKLFENKIKDLQLAFYMRKKSLMTKIQSLDICNQDIIQNTNKFYKSVIVDGMDCMTHKIKSETFLKFINLFMKDEKNYIDSMRIKAEAIKQSFYHKRNIFDGKLELSGILRPIDFEKLEIQKKSFIIILDEKNIQLIGLKQLTGASSRALTSQKKILAEKQSELQAILQKLNFVKTTEQKLNEEQRAIRNDMNKVNSQIESLTLSMKQYKAPQIFEYAMIQAELIKLRKKLKLMQRLKYMGHLKIKNLQKKLKDNKFLIKK